MATRAKPKEMVAESQKVFGFGEKSFTGAAIILAFLIGIAAIGWGVGGLRHEKHEKSAASASVAPTAVSSSTSECVSGHPCAVFVNEDGTSDSVSVPGGMTVCFEPWIWTSLEGVRLMVSFQFGSGRNSIPLLE